MIHRWQKRNYSIGNTVLFACYFTIDIKKHIEKLFKAFQCEDRTLTSLKPYNNNSILTVLFNKIHNVIKDFSLLWYRDIDDKKEIIV